MENKIYRCTVCGYEYDQSKEGTSFDELSADWTCPVCGVFKSEFEELGGGTPALEESSATDINDHIVIIGSGFAGTNLAQEIFAGSSTAKITIVTNEKEWFYSRPLLTRSFSNKEIKKNMYLMKYQDMKTDRLNILTTSEVKKIDSSNKEIKVNDTLIKYDKLVIATGSSAFIPPNYQKYRSVFKVLNNLNDYEELLKLRNNKRTSWAIIGGGLIGCELASEFNKIGDNVELFHNGDRLIENVLSNQKSSELLKHFESKGIKVYLQQNIEDIEKLGRKYDAVLMAVGFRPRIGLAKKSGIDCNRGIMVNDYMETSQKDIFAIGDVAEIDTRTYAFLAPITEQVNFLSNYLLGKSKDPIKMGEYPVKIKIHDLDL